MNILVVVSHPDDEVLGFGASGYKFALKGANITSCILSSRVRERNYKPKNSILETQIYEAQKFLKFKKPILGDFANIAFNSIPQKTLVKFIESAILKTKADIIFTHHPEDLNIDHRFTSYACQAASRLFQRKKGIKKLNSLYFMEILSSTDWSFAQNNSFIPNTFFTFNKATLNRKIKALKIYSNVVRDFPHSRSIETINGLASVRGSQSGLNYAESFQCVFKNLSLDM